MQHDEIIWQTINNGFCSYKSKVARERTFCQNPYNVTGLCLRSACPLANSQYATTREEEGAIYLYIKTIERAHSPKDLWEKIKLPANYTKALELVSSLLEHYPKYLVHRNKQRLTKIHQMLIRMRKLQLKERPKIETINTKIEKREKGREKKALKAAQLDRAIEKELLERLKEVSDGEIYNYSEKHFNRALSKAGSKKETEEEEEEEEEEDEEVEEEDGEWEDGEEEDFEGDEDDEEDDDEEDEAPTSKKGAKKGTGTAKKNSAFEAEEEDEDEEAAPADYEVQYVEDLEESDVDDDIEDELDRWGGAGSVGSSSFYSKSSAATAAASKRKAPSSDGRAGRGASSGSGLGKDGPKRRKGTRVEIEYEDEVEPAARASAKDMEFNF